MKKTIMAAGAALAAAGLMLTGCGTDPASAGNGSEPGETATSVPVEVDFDGDYVLAADGGLFTLTITDTEVQVTKQSCVAEQPDDNESKEPDETESPSSSEEPSPSETPSAEPSDSVTTDPRESGFGELEKVEGEATATINWFDGGGYTDEDTTPIEALSDGAILRVGDSTFHAADGTQGKALQNQFENDCATGGPTKEPSGEPSDNPSDDQSGDDPTDDETPNDDEGDE